MPEDPTHNSPLEADPTDASTAPVRAFGRTASFAGPDGTPAAPPEPPPGYELLEEVGRGGMGVVYRAKEIALHREVAVKFLRDLYPPDSPEAQRFVQEAQITAQLQHPGVPPVHEVGTLADGRPFLVMKLVKGNTLQKLLRSAAPGDRGRLLADFERVCQTVGYAHSHGVIHRDLKPSNVMVGKFGEVQVMDWGLAKSLANPEPAPVAPRAPAEGTVIRAGRDPDSATKSGSVLGTPAFMSPEQAGGEVAKIDARSDVFGLGAVLCAILTGEPPYVGDDVSVCLMAIRGHLAGASERLAACGGDPEVVALCLRCLAPERANRPRDANEVAGAIAALRTAAEDRARAAELDRVRLEALHREQRHKRRVRVAVGGAGAVLLAAGAAFAWWADRQSGERKRQEAELREADLRGQLADERAAAERRERLGRNAGTVTALLAECEKALRADNAPAAGLVLEQARKWAAEGGADHLADQLARCEADLRLLVALDQLDQRWTVVAGTLRDGRRAAAPLPDILSRYGIVPGVTPRAEAVDRIHRSLVRDHVLTALDQWLEWSPSAEVLALLRAADPDEFRDTVRGAVAARALPRVDQLAGRPEALDQPARYAAVLGDTAAVHPVRRRRLLLAALDRQPGDFRLLMTIGHLVLIDTPGAPDEYEKWFRAAAAVRPHSPVAHNYLGLALLNKKDRAAAVTEFRTAVALFPQYASAYNNLGVALHQSGEIAEAVAAFRSAVRCNPDFVLANANLGELLELTQDLEGAARCYAEWVRLAPDNPAALNRFARLLATAPEAGVRDGRKAVELAKRACDRSEWKVAAYLDTLAAAHAEAGEFGKAVETQKRALTFPQFAGDPGADPRYRLTLYGQNRPYRQPVRPPLAPLPREVNRP